MAVTINSHVSQPTTFQSHGSFCTGYTTTVRLRPKAVSNIDSYDFISTSTNTYLTLFNDFQKECHEMGNMNPDLYKKELENLFKRTSSVLVSLRPEKIAIEIGFDNSLIFTFSKNSNLIFLEVFLFPVADEQVVYVHYFNKNKMPSFSGSFRDGMKKLLELLDADSFSTKIESTEYELSY